MTDPKKPVERDEHTGVETTGHEWDGLKELNLPAPRWWLVVFLITCIWAVGYWFVYPAWPTLSGNGVRGGTAGSAGWTEYKKLAAEQQQINERRGEFVAQIKSHSLQEIEKDPKLYAFAVAGGKTMFKENCSACHGTGAEGRKGYPNLNDDDWLWGGSLNDIYATIKHGIRSSHEQTRSSQMPPFGTMLTREQTGDVADHVLSLSTGKSENAAGAALYKQNCSSCHGESGKGGRSVGAPNLADAIWLYGGDKGSIVHQIQNPRMGVMPTWESRLPDETIKELTIYVHSLGGGEAASPAKQ